MEHANLSWPLVLLSKGGICPETGRYMLTWHRKRIKPEKWRRFTYHTHPYKEWMEMKNYMEDEGRKKGKWTPPSDPFLKPYPYIAELLTNPRWDDGKPRELCTFGVRWGIDNVQVNISDKKMKATASTTAATLPEALELMEQAFQDGQNLWRQWRN